MFQEHIYSIEELAKLGDVNVTTIGKARSVLKNGMPQIAALVKSGEVSVRLANLSHGSNQHATKNVESPLDHSTFKPVTQTQAADLLGVHAHAPSENVPVSSRDKSSLTGDRSDDECRKRSSCTSINLWPTCASIGRSAPILTAHQ